MSEQKILEMPLADLDPEVAEAIELERKRQQNTLEMIASENFVPRAVMQSQGSVLTGYVVQTQLVAGGKKDSAREAYMEYASAILRQA